MEVVADKHHKSCGECKEAKDGVFSKVICIDGVHDGHGVGENREDVHEAVHAFAFDVDDEECDKQRDDKNPKDDFCPH